MLRFLVFTVLVQYASAQQYQQRTVPGVPPQTYEQNYQPPPPPPQPIQQQQPMQGQQQFQQPPQQQFQQPPQQQFQQPPQQQQQFQQPPQQQQFQQPTGGHHDPQLLNPTNINQEREHIQEHMDVPIDTSKMSEQELMFHYFKMHDADNNNKLDGCELIKSLIHWHDESGNELKHKVTYKDEDLVVMVDGAMKQADTNDDGYISYEEFRTGTMDADGNEIKHTVTYGDEDLAQMVEGALKQADANDDGYITYAEFRSITGSAA